MSALWEFHPQLQFSGDAYDAEDLAGELGDDGGLEAGELEEGGARGLQQMEELGRALALAGVGQHGQEEQHVRPVQQLLQEAPRRAVHKLSLVNHIDAWLHLRHLRTANQRQRHTQYIQQDLSISPWYHPNPRTDTFQTKAIGLPRITLTQNLNLIKIKGKYASKRKPLGRQHGVLACEKRYTRKQYICLYWYLPVVMFHKPIHVSNTYGIYWYIVMFHKQLRSLEFLSLRDRTAALWSLWSLCHASHCPLMRLCLKWESTSRQTEESRIENIKIKAYDPDLRRRRFRP